MDALAAQGTLLARAYCNFAWCAPSRNSFLSGRTPDTTQAWNFLNSFRQAPGAQDWVTLPGYFKRAGYYATSLGKVFHPDLPPNFDYPASWTGEWRWCRGTVVVAVLSWTRCVSCVVCARRRGGALVRMFIVPARVCGFVCGALVSQTNPSCPSSRCAVTNP